MGRGDHRGRLGDVHPAAFVPAGLLVVGVPLLMTTQYYDRYGLYAIFWSFAGGAVIFSLALVLGWFRLASTRASKTLLAVGTSLTVAAILLYLVYGCVFGCLG